MSLTQWTPMSELEAVFDRFNRVIDGPRNREPFALGEWTPRVDIFETEKEIVVKAELPEVNKEDVRVVVQEGVLTIEGQRKLEFEPEGVKVLRAERIYGKFIRTFNLPESIDETKIEATFRHGMLVLTMPKVVEAKRPLVEVKLH